MSLRDIVVYVRLHEVDEMNENELVLLEIIKRLEAENAEMRTVLKRVAGLAEGWFESDEENDVSLRDNWYGNRLIETLGKYAKERPSLADLRNT